MLMLKLISQNSQWSGLQSCAFCSVDDVDWLSRSDQLFGCRPAGRQRERQRGRGSGARPFAAVAARRRQLLLLFPARLSAHLHALAPKPPCDACEGDIALQELGLAVKENVLFSRCDLDSLPDSPDVWLLCCCCDCH